MFKEPNALQVRITLNGIEPDVWRRVVLPWDWHLGQLHLVIQAAFNWWNYHLHEFNIGGLRYGDPDTDGWGTENDTKVFDEIEVRLLDFERKPRTALRHLYDFGDGWEHTVEIEQLLALDAVPRSATCVAGSRARPPEDVGGLGGYERFLTIMADPSDPEHADIKQWCGGHFDPEWFDLAMADKDVKNALKPNVRQRLHQLKPKRPKLSS